MKKAINYIYILLTTYILIVVFFSNNKIYYSLRKPFLLNNIILILIMIIPLVFIIKKQINISDEKYKKILIILSTITFILQIFIIYNTYFYTDWDVKTLRNIVINNDVVKNYYLTKYPNNLLYVSILMFYKSIPLIGKHYFPLLIFNAFLVNISGIMASLTIKRFTNNFLSILGYFILLIITILSPWINIPYSDTFAVAIPISIIYFYTKENKNKIDYILIGFLSILGYYIKPTVLIVFIGIVIIYLLDLLKSKELKIKTVKYIALGIITAYLLCNISIKLTGFKPVETTKPFNMIHYLAMGQNNETYGLFNEKDVEDSNLYGNRKDINKIVNRIKMRKILGQFRFIEIKTLLNFNDGTFSWGGEGENFYKKVLAKKNKVSILLQDYFYKDYKYNYIFQLIVQAFWLLVLLLIPLAVYKEQKEKNTLLYLSIIGIILFLTLFECRARYLYCYSPVFITLAMIGLNNLKNKIIKVEK